MRLQPLGNAHVHASVNTNAATLSDWIHEWIQLVSYGPTYDRLEWTVPAQTEETVRLQLESPMSVDVRWTDHSVSWETFHPGKWSVDITKAVEVTLYLKAEMGEYIKQNHLSGPPSVKAIKLKPYLELACDDVVPFVIEKEPVATMYWSPQINLQQMVDPGNA
ncbi:hypothetical protein N9A45_00710 [bacterium]|nr:hypothetical protein [bacterium]